MKYIIIHTIRLLVLSAIVLLPTSCLKEEENLFGQSSAERVMELMENYEKILNEAPKGWSMEYYAKYEPERLGGFQILCSFDHGMVKMSANLSYSSAQKGTYTSSYSFSDMRGPTLSFDTYNPIIHYFSSPTSTSNLGPRGDFEFSIIEATNDKIVMKGFKFGNKIVMRRLSEEVDWQQFQSDVNRIDTIMQYYYRFEVFKNETSLAMASSVVSNSFNSKQFNVTEGGSGSMSFICIPGGIQLYDPVEIAGTQVERFDWDAEKRVLNSVGADDDFQLRPTLLSFDDIPGKYEVTASDRMDPDYVTITVKEPGVSFTVSEGLFKFPFTMNYDGRRFEVLCGQILHSEPELDNNNTPTGNVISYRLMGTATTIIGTTGSYLTGSMYAFWRTGYPTSPGLGFEPGAEANFITGSVYGLRVRKYINNDSTSDYLDNGGVCQDIIFKKIN